MVGAIGGEQILNMGDGCQYVGLVLHEFGHAIGYFHEHNRPDRDDVVNIMWDNIQYGKKESFFFQKTVRMSCLKWVTGSISVTIDYRAEYFVHFTLSSNSSLA